MKSITVFRKRCRLGFSDNEVDVKRKTWARFFNLPSLLKHVSKFHLDLFFEKVRDALVLVFEAYVNCTCILNDMNASAENVSARGGK